MYLRSITPVLERFSKLYPALGITGPRQSGKTTKPARDNESKREKSYIVIYTTIIKYQRFLRSPGIEGALSLQVGS